MRMSELIERCIREMLEESGSVDIQRNELAQKMGCVPSQINYVLHSRFRPEYGFLVESRRGGGGYIRVTRIRLGQNPLLMHLINSIGESIDAQSCRVILKNLQENGLLREKEAAIMSAALADQAYQAVEQSQRDALRAAVLKNMLLTLI